MISYAFTALTAAAEETVALPIPAIAYPIIAAVVFTFLAFVIWSFRDVANRHSHKTGGSAGHDAAHH
jgi:putative flippase GtrA